MQPSKGLVRICDQAGVFDDFEKVIRTFRQVDLFPLIPDERKLGKMHLSFFTGRSRRCVVDDKLPTLRQGFLLQAILVRSVKTEETFPLSYKYLLDSAGA